MTESLVSLPPPIRSPLTKPGLLIRAQRAERSLDEPRFPGDGICNDVGMRGRVRGKTEPLSWCQEKGGLPPAPLLSSPREHMRTRLLSCEAGV